MERPKLSNRSDGMTEPRSPLDSNQLPSPHGEEIIAAIRLKRSDPESDKGSQRHPRRMTAVAALLLVAALTGGGIWGIGYLARHPLLSPAAPRPADSPPVPRPQAAPEPPPLPPEAATTAPPSPTSALPAGRTATASQHLASAERWAAGGNLSAAQAELEEALRLDPQSRQALAGLHAVKARMVAEEFRHWMAEGFAALNRDDFKTAQERFLQAKALRPEAGEVREALAQADARQRSARIEALRQTALSAEQREDWASAQRAYEEALGWEPTLQIAQQGRERAAALVTLERRMTFFTTQPKVLDSDAQLENAERLLQDIQAGPPAGPRLHAEAEKLKSLVQAAKTPVRVIIESDQLTQVAVYRVGRLGLFSVRELSLRPGTYTVVGSRDGYRDERLELIVQPGPETIRVTVVCRAKI